MKSGIVTIIGRPSVGKSTFLNTVCGQSVSIVSPVPQTTRSAVRGILTVDAGQIVFIDTPGYHVCEKKLNRHLQAIAQSKLHDADLILYLVDVTRSFGEEESHICHLLQDVQNKLIIAINKMDEDTKRLDFSHITHLLPEVSLAHIHNISSTTKQGLDSLIQDLFSLLPTGELLYPKEFYTDQEVSFRIAEIIRGQGIAHTRDEIPHALYVRIEDLEFKKNGKLLWCRAFLYVEKESQKSMVIGKNAKTIKSIRIQSEKELRKILPYSIALDIQVKVHKNWRQKEPVLQSTIKM